MKSRQLWTHFWKQQLKRYSDRSTSDINMWPVAAVHPQKVTEEPKPITIMGKPTGFMEFDRKTTPYREPETRVEDWQEMNLDLPEEELKQQGARCMDCGIPFCQTGSDWEGKSLGCPIPQSYSRVERPCLSREMERGSAQDSIKQIISLNLPVEYVLLLVKDRACWELQIHLLQ